MKEQSNPPVPFDSIKIGMRATHTKIIRESDITSFAQISGDFNPLHFDDEYASDMGFEQRIAHGMISSSLFSGLFGTKLPGPGCLFISQSFKYKRPVYVGDTITAEILVESVNLNRRVVGFLTTCKKNDVIVVSGDAKLFVPKSQSSKKDQATSEKSFG